MVVVVTAYVVRLWIPDRPGALGQVASRIGAVRGDVIGIEILERGAGRAVDELFVTLPDPSLVDLLIAEINQVDGVDVEDVRELNDPERDPGLDALEAAARVAEADSAQSVLSTLCMEAQRAFDAEWVAVANEHYVSCEVGHAPSGAWMSAFVIGISHCAQLNAPGGPDDVAWAPLGRSGLDVLLGRHGRPLRTKERRQLMALARIAAVRVSELQRPGT